MIGTYLYVSHAEIARQRHGSESQWMEVLFRSSLSFGASLSLPIPISYDGNQCESS